MKRNKLFKNIFLCLFIIFIGLYIASVSGYYEANLANKVVLKNNEIKEFEEDILNGKTIDINSYFENKRVDYSNKFTKAGESITNSLIKIFTKSIKHIWGVTKSLFI